MFVDCCLLDDTVRCNTCVGYFENGINSDWQLKPPAYFFPYHLYELWEVGLGRLVVASFNCIFEVLLAAFIVDAVKRIAGALAQAVLHIVPMWAFVKKLFQDGVIAEF